MNRQIQIDTFVIALNTRGLRSHFGHRRRLRCDRCCCCSELSTIFWSPLIALQAHPVGVVIDQRQEAAASPRMPRLRRSRSDEVCFARRREDHRPAAGRAFKR